MSTIFILFFVSLFGIILMIGRKLLVLKNSHVQNTESISFEILEPEAIKHIANKNLKKYGYILLVAGIRSYVRSSKLLKNKYNAVKTKIINKLDARKIDLARGLPEKREVSKFLKMVGEYKQKINRIKHQIVEEENMK